MPDEDWEDWIEQGTEEWDRMWKALAELTINVGQDDPMECRNDCEYWQYMGTEFRGDVNSKKWQHCFRHRCHPRTLEREYVWIEKGGD